MGLEAGIWGSRLRYGPGGGGGGTEEEEEEKEKEKIPLCESIGHRPLRGRCPKSKKEKIVAKALDGQRYPCPALVGCG